MTFHDQAFLNIQQGTWNLLLGFSVCFTKAPTLFLGTITTSDGKDESIRYLIIKAILYGKSARWSLQLFELDITCIIFTSIIGKTTIDLLVTFSGEKEQETSDQIFEELPKATCIMALVLDLWTLHFAGSSTSSLKGAKVMLTSQKGYSQP